MVPAKNDVQIVERACDSLCLHARSIAARLKTEMRDIASGTGDLNRLASLCCNLSQLDAVVRKAIQLGASSAPQQLVELSMLIEESIGPVTDYAIREMETEAWMPRPLAADATVRIEKLLAFTAGAGAEVDVG